MSASWKGEVNTYGDPPDAWSSNGLRFDTEDLAYRYTSGLADRWVAVTKWRVVPSDDPPNKTTDAEGRMVDIPAPAPVTAGEGEVAP